MKKGMILKRLAAAAAGAVMLINLAACGNAAETETKTEAGTEIAAEIKDEADIQTDQNATAGGAITFWYMGDGSANIEPLISEFTAESGIEVNVQSIPWQSLSEKLLTAISSQSGPDVMQTAVSRTAELVEAGAIMDMTSYIDSTETLSTEKFFDAAYSSLEVDGKYYGVPWIADVYLLFYRTDLFADAGYTEFPKTWEEFHEACKTITSQTGKYSYEILGANDYNFLFCYPLQSGSEMITADGKPAFNQKEFVDSMNYLNSFYTDGLANRIFDNVDRQTKLANGEIAACMGGTWLIPLLNEIPDIEGKWSLAQWPKGPAANDSVYAGSNLVVTSWNKNTDASVKLVEFLSRPENQLKYFEKTSSLPTCKETWENETLKGNEVFAVFYEQLGNAKQFPKVPEMEEIAIDCTKYFERISLGQEEVQTVMDEFNLHAEDILARK